MDLKNFKSTYKSVDDLSEKANADDVRKKAEQYATKSDDELLKDIMKTAAQGKANGSLDEQQLKTFVQSVSPMLSEEQRARLQSVIDIINTI